MFTTTNYTSSSYNIHRNSPISNGLRAKFIGAFAVSLPLMFDFVLDQCIGARSAKYFETIKTHRFADFLIISSVFLTGVVVIFGSEYTVEFLYSIVGCGQCLAMCGLYGRLIVLSKGKWNAANCSVLMSFFMLSELFLVHQVKDCGIGGGSCFSMTYFFLSIIANAVNLVLHFYMCSLSLLSFRRNKIVESKPAEKAKPDVYLTKYACMLTSTLIMLFLAVRLILLCVVGFRKLEDTQDARELTGGNLMVLLVVAIIAASLPGRVVRLGIMNLKVGRCIQEKYIEIEWK